MSDIISEPHGSDLILYTTEDNGTRIEVRFEGETAWLSQSQMVELFQTTKQNISLHIKNVFAEGELAEDSVVKEYLTTAADGKKYRTLLYNLDVVISVGYRVKSLRGTQFRIWATQRLREYLIKGFTMDDERLKAQAGGGYFDELLARIRDIRSSEKLFWSKVLDIYATSVDYNPDVEASQTFFRTVQNKMHWAAHGHTAAEVIKARADSTLPNMGLTSWAGQRPRKADATVAKNYLHKDEIEALNLIVTLYLDFAELQALNRRQMTMTDWLVKLDDFLRLSERDILTHTGKISSDAARGIAEAEYEKYRQLEANKPTPVESHFEEAISKTKQLDRDAKKRRRAGK